MEIERRAVKEGIATEIAKSVMGDWKMEVENEFIIGDRSLL